VAPEFLTVRDVVDELAASEWVVLKLIRTGELPAQRLSARQVLVERGMLERWVEDQYARTRRWILENPNSGFHGDWKDWPIGRVDGDGRLHPSRG
jgi:hypothetical protein